MLVGTVAKHLRRPTHSWKGESIKLGAWYCILNFLFRPLQINHQVNFENVGYIIWWCKFRYLLQHRKWFWRMTGPLLKTSTNSNWSSKACKFDSWNELPSCTMQVDLKHVLLIQFSMVLMSVLILDDRAILGCLGTNTCYWSLYKTNLWRIPPSLLQNHNQIFWWHQPRSRNMVPKRPKYQMKPENKTQNSVFIQCPMSNVQCLAFHEW